MKCRSVSIVSPSALSSNPRAIKEASVLAASQFEVRTTSARTLNLVDDMDATLLRDARWDAFRIDFLSRSFRRRRRVLQELQRVLFLATGASRAAELAHSPISALLEKSLAEQSKADLYIAHYVAALPAAARAAKLHGALYAFDAEDFHLGDLPDTPAHALEKSIIRAIEGRYLPGAAYVTAASPMIAEAYAKAYRIPLPTTVLNVFPKRNAPDRPTPRGTAGPGPSLYWFSQTIGPGRGLEMAVEAIARAVSRPHLYLRGVPIGRYADDLRRLATQAGTGERLHLLDPALPDDLERLGAAYDLGYVGELAETRNRQIAITNKVFSYLLSGLPSLASDIPAHRRIAPDLGPAMGLFPIGDAAALAAAIDAILLDPPRLANARAHAWRLGQERYNWEAEAPRFLGQVQTVLNGDLSCQRHL